MEKCGFFAKRGKQRIEIFFKVFWMTGEREEILKKLTEVLKEGVSVATGQKTTIFMVCGGEKRRLKWKDKRLGSVKSTPR